MKVLIACEESQAVTKEFRRLGHTAYSCDILPCSGGHPEWHLQMDVFEAYERYSWDFVISFPPCTDLTVSGARWFEAKRNSGDQERSIEFFFKVWEISDIVENPIGVLNKRDYILKWFPDLYHRMDAMGFPFKPSQIIQPWQFGHGETKATCLWIREGLPLLQPTDIVEGRDQKMWRLPPSKDRAKLRSKTYPGIAKAIAEQYGEYILENKPNASRL